MNFQDFQRRHIRSLKCSAGISTDVATGPAGLADYGAGSGIVDIFDNALSSAEKAFSEYNAHANTPPPASTISAIGKDITTPAVVVVGVLFLIWMLH